MPHPQPSTSPSPPEGSREESTPAALLTRLTEEALGAATRLPLVIGLSGAQGCGKSTVAAAVAAALAATGRRVAVLSLDDLYLPKVEREALASVHPLLRLRGVPGTHDPRLGLSLLKALGRSGPVRLPRFDKAVDDRRAVAEWDETAAPVDVVLFEGWCVGARPQPDTSLAEPVNALERDEDADGRWRVFVNRQLAGDYRRLFGRIDRLAFLAAPDFSVVAGWRRQQEDGLRRDLAAREFPSDGCMSDGAIDHFVLTYQRLTEHMLRDLPGRADLVIRLNGERRAVAIERLP